MFLAFEKTPVFSYFYISSVRFPAWRDRKYPESISFGHFRNYFNRVYWLTFLIRGIGWLPFLAKNSLTERDNQNDQAEKYYSN